MTNAMNMCCFFLVLKFMNILPLQNCRYLKPTQITELFYQHKPRGVMDKQLHVHHKEIPTNDRNGLSSIV